MLRFFDDMKLHNNLWKDLRLIAWNVFKYLKYIMENTLNKKGKSPLSHEYFGWNMSPSSKNFCLCRYNISLLFVMFLIKFVCMYKLYIIITVFLYIYSLIWYAQCLTWISFSRLYEKEKLLMLVIFQFLIYQSILKCI